MGSLRGRGAADVSSIAASASAAEGIWLLEAGISLDHGNEEGEENKTGNGLHFGRGKARR